MSQKDLDALAQKHMGQYQSNQYGMVRNYKDMLEPWMLEDIYKLTAGCIYILIHAKFDDRIFIGGWDEVRREYLYEDEVLIRYPYLKKYPKWDRLFEDTHCGFQYYLITTQNYDWLMKKHGDYNMKQSLM